MLPNMDEAAKQGWNVFFWAIDQQVNPVLKDLVYLAIFVAQCCAAWRRSRRPRA